MKSLILLLALCFAIPSTAQTKPSNEKCTINVAQSPEVRGFKLGQAYDLLKDANVRLRGDEDGTGTRQVILWNASDSNPRFKGINRLTLIYLDGLLASFQVRYTSDVKWETDDHFAAVIAEQLRLPRAGWVRETHLTLNCDGFVVHVYASLGGVLKIERSGLEQEIEQRKEAQEQKKRGRFKP